MLGWAGGDLGFYPLQAQHMAELREILETTADRALVLWKPVGLKQQTSQNHLLGRYFYVFLNYPIKLTTILRLHRVKCCCFVDVTKLEF